MELEGILLNGQVLSVTDLGAVSIDGNVFASTWIDPIDSLASYSTEAPLTANQGRVLNDFITTLNGIVASDDVTLNTLQEVVDFTKANKNTLDNLGIHHISGLQAALDEKLSAATLLELGTTSTTAFRGDQGLVSYNHSQEAHAPSNAEANIQGDWNQIDIGHDGYILNKPTTVDGGNY